MKKRIGWIGTGVMGASMAKHLLLANHSLVIFSRTRKKAESLEQNGAKWVNSPAEVARETDLIFTMLGYPCDVEDVLLGENGVFNGVDAGNVLVDMTTSSPELARQLSIKFQEKGATFIDAPVSGGDKGARDGSLVIMCGGDYQVYQEVYPQFKVLGEQIEWFGESGAGQQAKMSNQILIASTMIGMVESLLYAERAKLDVPKVIEILSQGAASCWSLSNLAPRILNQDWKPGFYIKHFIKDIEIALDDASRMNLNLPGLSLAHEFYQRAKEEGWGDSGTQALMKVLRSMNLELK